MTNIAEAPAPTKIVFGTDGWRARIADEYTFENVRRCADGVARYVIERGEQAKGVVIAYDRRFASEHFAAAAAEVLLAHDIPVAFASHAVPTQMSSYEVVERGAAAGIVITASHNPWTDNGFKVKAPTGSPAGPEILAVLEATIATNGGAAIARRPFADAEAAGLVERFDPFEGYERYLRRTLDLDALKAADVSILVEPMWGAGAGWISRLLEGGKIRVTELHQERNPYFGGVNPEPIRPTVDEALGILSRGGYDLGLMLDGDADRAGAADERGQFIHQLEVTGLLMYYLAEYRGLRDPVVISV
ncbi:MAG: phosphoglucomutase/phosphomannomutase family protein, partial [Candidatus Limnocylindrales bacterium]